MKKVVVLFLSILFIFAGCDGNIGGDDPGIPSNPEDIPVVTIPTGPMFRGDLSELGIDSNGVISFTDYQEYYDFHEKYLVNGDGEKIILSAVPYQDLKPEYQLEYDSLTESLSNEYSEAKRRLDEDFQAGLITAVEYHSQLEILEDEYQLKTEVLGMDFMNRQGIWGDVRIRIVGKNLTLESVSLYLVDMDYSMNNTLQLIGPIKFDATDEWQSFIYRFDNGGNRYNHVNSGYSYHMEI